MSVAHRPLTANRGAAPQQPQLLDDRSWQADAPRSSHDACTAQADYQRTQQAELCSSGPDVRLPEAESRPASTLHWSHTTGEPHAPSISGRSTTPHMLQPPWATHDAAQQLWRSLRRQGSSQPRPAHRATIAIDPQLAGSLLPLESVVASYWALAAPQPQRTTCPARYEHEPTQHIEATLPLRSGLTNLPPAGRVAAPSTTSQGRRRFEALGQWSNTQDAPWPPKAPLPTAQWRLDTSKGAVAAASGDGWQQDSRRFGRLRCF